MQQVCVGAVPVGGMVRTLKELTWGALTVPSAVAHPRHAFASEHELCKEEVPLSPSLLSQKTKSARA